MTAEICSGFGLSGEDSDGKLSGCGGGDGGGPTAGRSGRADLLVGQCERSDGFESRPLRGGRNGIGEIGEWSAGKAAEAATTRRHAPHRPRVSPHQLRRLDGLNVLMLFMSCYTDGFAPRLFLRFTVLGRGAEGVCWEEVYEAEQSVVDAETERD